MEGTEEIRRYKREIRRPGKRYSTKAWEDKGGKRSRYVLTEGIEKLKKTMEKPQALDFLYDKIIRSTLAQKLAKFNFSAIFHAIKMDERSVHRLMGPAAAFLQETLTQKDYDEFNVIFQQIRKLDDNGLEQLADSISKSIIEDRGYYALSYLPGLLKL